MTGLIDVRCPNCNKLLFQAEPGAGQVVIKCERCKQQVRWPSTKAELVAVLPLASTPLAERVASVAEG